MVKHSKFRTAHLAAFCVLTFLTAGCGSILSFKGSNASKGSTPPGNGAPLPPIATTGAFLTGLLSDENGVSVANTTVQSTTDAVQFQTDEIGKFNIPIAGAAPASIALSVTTAAQQTYTGNVAIPSDVAAEISLGDANPKILKVTMKSDGTLSSASLSRTAPVISGIIPNAVLTDGILSGSEVFSGDAATRALPLYSMDSSGSVSQSFALIAESATCDEQTQFELSSIPTAGSLTGHRSGSFKLCARLSAADSSMNFAQSAPFSVYLNPVLNDSEGALARFSWNVPDATKALIATASDPALLDSWDGTDSPLGGVTISNSFAGCTDNAYSSSASGTLTATGKCGINLTGVAWSKLHVRLSFALGSGSVLMSKRFTAGVVPAGMVLVAKEAWPAEYNNATALDGHPAAGPFDFAIDKYETSSSNTDASSEALGAFPNTNAIQLNSILGVIPYGRASWFAHKQGCANRTAAGFTDGAKARRQVHLATDLEWFVASAGTPDVAGAPYCNSDGASGSKPHATGDASAEYCVSDYGARDMIGNMLEWTDGLWSLDSSTQITRTTFSGTAEQKQVVFVTPNGGSPLKPADKFITDWNPLLAFAVSIAAKSVAAFNGDQIAYFTNSNTSGVGSLRGGYYKNNVTGGSGRHYLRLDYLASYSGASMDFVGGRCALVAP